MWPASTPEIEEAVVRVLRSGRWAISGMSTGHGSEERKFGRAFARYIGVEHGIPTASGSSAIVAALTALGIGVGDEVLVPGVVWVACASAVARLGATPILVDLTVDDFAMDPAHASALTGPRTAAILMVHLSSSIADVDELTLLAERHHLVLLEDCSQAHGAVWRGRRVGTFGRAAAFSFQSSKLLTAGEGGIVVTDDDSLADAAQQARADGRRWNNGRVREGFPDLVVGGTTQGHNHCMTEMQAAILTASLPALDEQNAARIEMVTYLEQQLSPIEGVQTVRRRDDPRVDRPTFWHLPVRIDPEAFGGHHVEHVREAVSFAAGLFLEPVGAPLNRNPLYNPQLYRRFTVDHRLELLASGTHLPVCELLARTCLTIPHHALLGGPVLIDRLVEAFVAVQQRARRVRPS